MPKIIDSVLVHDDSPDQSTELEQQRFHLRRQPDLLCGRQLDARLVLVEQARLGILELARHLRLSPSLSRTGESLEAHRSRRAAIEEYRGRTAAQHTACNAPLPRASSTPVCRRSTRPAEE